jgi:hypothetical protein
MFRCVYGWRVWFCTVTTVSTSRRAGAVYSILEHGWSEGTHLVDPLSLPLQAVCVVPTNRGVVNWIVGYVRTESTDGAVTRRFAEPIARVRALD